MRKPPRIPLLCTLWKQLKEEAPILELIPVYAAAVRVLGLGSERGRVNCCAHPLFCCQQIHLFGWWWRIVCVCVLTAFHSHFLTHISLFFA